MKLSIFTFLFLASYFVAFSQTGVLSIPESYIKRHSIKQVSYLNSSDKIQSRVLFTKEGSVKEVAEFIQPSWVDDSLLIVLRYEYDSTNAISSIARFQHFLGSNEFPTVTVLKYLAHSSSDSLYEERYADGYGYNISTLIKKSWVEYEVPICGGILERFDFGGDTLSLKRFSDSTTDSLVFEDDRFRAVYTYSCDVLRQCVTYSLNDTKTRTFIKTSFDNQGIPIREENLFYPKVEEFRIEVEHW